MFFADYHVHTHFSNDAKHSMTDMAVAAAKCGIKELCFTDHVEDCCENDPIGFDIGNYFEIQDECAREFYETREKLRGHIDIKLGAEVSAINHEPELAKEISQFKDLDFIIGSVHNLKNMNDFYFLEYESKQQCDQLIEKYLEENIEVAKLGCCDIIGHIGYAGKYMREKGFTTDVMDFPDHLRFLFKTIAENGLGIEINTSGLRKQMNLTIPHFEVLKLYRECGGEVITAGSDAHLVKDAGANISDAYDLLRKAGFKYVTVFEKRKPDFIKL